MCVFFHQINKTYTYTHSPTRTYTYNMPKRVERWSDLVAPVTPLQQSAYMDACIMWIVAEPDVNPPLTIQVPTTDPIGHGGYGCDDVVARPSESFMDQRSWLCIVCRSEVTGVKPQIGNPFAQHCWVVTCPKCRVSSSG